VGTVNYLYKMAAAVAMIPVLYLVHAGVRRYLGEREVERMRQEAAR
jgi:queuosine precursor transporter